MTEAAPPKMLALVYSEYTNRPVSAFAERGEAMQ